MISITNNAAVPGSENLIVFSPSGDYADVDLILCAETENPALAIKQLQAQFIAYGPAVYQFNTPEALGETLYAIDPNSTHDAVALYKEELARDAARNAGTLVPTDPVPAPDSPTISADSASSAIDEIPSTDMSDYTVDPTTEASGTTDITANEQNAIDVPMDLIDTNGSIPAEDSLGTTTPEVISIIDTPSVDLSTTTPE